MCQSPNPKGTQRTTKIDICVSLSGFMVYSEFKCLYTRQNRAKGIFQMEYSFFRKDGTAPRGPIPGP